MNLWADLATINWVPVIGALPPLLTLLWKFSRTPRSRSNLDEMIELHDKLPDALRGQMTDAMGAHLQDYLRERDRFSRRKLDGGIVAALVLVTAASFAVLSFLAWLAGSVHVLFWVAFGAAAFVSFVFVMAGIGQVYKYPERNDE